MALRWVKENIEYFGGDPNNITLCGNSSAATNIHLIMLSPLAKGIENILQNFMEFYSFQLDKWSKI